MQRNLRPQMTHFQVLYINFFKPLFLQIKKTRYDEVFFNDFSTELNTRFVTFENKMEAMVRGESDKLEHKMGVRVTRTEEEIKNLRIELSKMNK